MTAISLVQESVNVTVLDKVSIKQRTGAGLKVDSGGLELSKTARLLRKLASGGKSSVQLWSSIEKRLRNEVEKSSKINLIYHSRVERSEERRVGKESRSMSRKERDGEK